MREFILALVLVTFSSTSKAQTVTLQELQSHFQKMQSAPFNEKSCKVNLDALSEKLKAIDLSSYPTAELKSGAGPLIKSSWDLRLALHSRLADFDRECVLQVREIFHQLRDYEDYLVEASENPEDLNPADLDFQKQARPIYDRDAYSAYFVAQAFDKAKFEFKTGDLILARGISFFSAIISQISDNRAHFSHAFIVSVTDQGAKIQTIESYVGKGVRSYDINFALKNENVRLMVFRPKDPVLGEKAAVAALAAAAQQLPYDYKMDFEDDSQMSCVEVPVYAYKIASEQKIKLPLYTAQLHLNNSDFLTKMGLKNGPLITPDDLETDPRFTLILDWKDTRLVRDSRQKDAVLAEIVRWLDQKQYHFHDTLKSNLVVHVLLPLRQTFLWDFLKNLSGVPEIDKHIPPQTLSVMTLLDQTAGILLQELKKQDEAFKAANGRVLTNMQLRERLEEIRARDLQDFKAKKDSLFHKIFRPDNMNLH